MNEKMNEKRFTIDKDGRTILDNIDDSYCECVDGYEAKQYCEKLNELSEENQQLRELLENGLEVSQVEIDEELRRRKND